MLGLDGEVEKVKNAEEEVLGKAEVTLDDERAKTVADMLALASKLMDRLDQSIDKVEALITSLEVYGGIRKKS